MVWATLCGPVAVDEEMFLAAEKNLVIGKGEQKEE